MTSQGAQVIELFGPPGTGKTRVLQILAAQRQSAGGKWKTVAEALRCRRELPIAWQLHGVIEPLVRHSALLQKIYYRAPTSAEKREALVSAAAEWRPFIECCLDPTNSDSLSPERRLLGLHALAETLQVRALLASMSQSGHLVISDEPLSHKCFQVFSEGACDVAKERSYFATMPLPAGLVHFSASVDTIVDRLQRQHREIGKIILRHRGLDEREVGINTEWALEISKQGAAILEQRGVPVLWLDAEQRPENSAQEVDAFIYRVRILSSSCHGAAAL